MAAPSFSIATAPVACGSRSVGGEVDVEVRGSTGGARLGAFYAGEEVEGVLGVGEDPDGSGSADVEGVGVAEGAELAGDAAEGLVEELGVGGVQGHEHIGGRGGSAGVVPDASFGELVAFFFGSPVGVEPEPGFVDEPGGVDLADLGWGRGDESVGERDGLDGEVVGLPGDGPGQPDRHQPGDHEGPEAGESVGQLQGVGDQLPRGIQA